MSSRELSNEYTRHVLGQLAGLQREVPLLARAILFEKLLRAGAASLGVNSWADTLVHDLMQATGNVPSTPCDVDVWQKALDSLPEVPQGIASNPEMIGWCYQTWNEPARNSNSWAISRRVEELNESAELDVLTQLFTDDYLADFLVERCFSLLGAESYSQSEVLTICDPACGVGHILLAAVKRLSKGGICPGWVGQCLFGFEIDPVAVAIARGLVFLQAIACGYEGDRDRLIRELRQSIVALPAPFGTLVRVRESSTPSFDVVVTNPPYLGRRKLSSEMREFLDREYPATNIDLCAAFMQRCIELCKPHGAVGLLTSDKWLRLRGYEHVRKGSASFKGILGELSLDYIVELGAKAFHPSVSLHDGVKAVMLCARKETPGPGHVFQYRNLTLTESYHEKVAVVRAGIGVQGGAVGAVEVAQQDWVERGTSSMLLEASDLPRNLVQSKQTVGQRAEVVVGIQTNNDAHYVRYVWQVPGGQPGWRIHSKGGGYARWCGLNRWVIDWERGAGSFFKTDKARVVAEQWADREGWSYTWFANGALGVRMKEAGWSFGRAAAAGVFSDDTRVIAFLNTRFASVASRAIGGKVQLPEGVVRALPLPETLAEVSPELVSLARTLKWEISRGDLCDAYYDPLLERRIVHGLVLEALLLVIEGLLEGQVERALGMNKDESRQWSEVHGDPVAWLSPSSDIALHPMWSCVQAYCSEYRAILAAYADTIPKPRGGAVVVDLRMRMEQQKLGVYPRRYTLPTTGAVEHVSRIYQVHPFDAVCALLECVESSMPAVTELCTTHLCAEVTREILRAAGHRWWSAAAHMNCENSLLLSQRELCEIVERCVEQQSHRALVGSCVKTWIRRVLIPWQEKRFYGVSPLRFSGMEQDELSCTHMWSL